MTRPPWSAVAGDCWHHVPDIEAAIAALAGPPRRVMLALGRMHADAFAAQAQHRYLLRFVDHPAQAPALPRHDLVVDRGPFTVEDDLRLLQTHGIDLVVCKNAGGPGARAKLLAARQLGVAVMMIDRPAPAGGDTVHDVEAVLRWLDHETDRGV